MIWLLAVAWWLSGFAGFVYWWTSDYNLGTGDVLLGFLCGFNRAANLGCGLVHSWQADSRKSNLDEERG